MPAILARQALPAALLANSRLMSYSIGGTLDAIFLGMIITQVFSYWHFIKTDSKLVVGIVALGVVATCGASLIVLLWQHSIFVWGYGNILTIVVTKWYLYLTPINIGTTLLVQIFYIDRCRNLFSHWWPVALILPFAICSFGIQIAFVHLEYGSRKYLSITMFDDTVPNALANTYLTLTIFTDVLITGIVVFGLHRVKTGWAHTDRKLQQLIVTCFEAQVPALAIAAVSCACWQNQDTVVMSFVMCTSKIYVLGMLITLNLRRSSAASAGGNNLTYASGSSRKQSEMNSYPLTSMPDLASSETCTSQAEEGSMGRKPSWEHDAVSAASGRADDIVIDRPGDQYASTARLASRHALGK